MADLVVQDASLVDKAVGKCQLVFSAVEMDKKAILALEMEYAARGFAVVSNNSAHRATEDVPVMIPEINPDHLDIIPQQRKHYGWRQGLLVVKPNCSIQSYMIPIYALMKAGYPISEMIVTTLQALSGAGYPGPAAIDLVDNVLPYIPGEEEKSEVEPAKIFGTDRERPVRARRQHEDIGALQPRRRERRPHRLRQHPLRRPETVAGRDHPCLAGLHRAAAAAQTALGAGAAHGLP